jgi:hypothetical protein
MKLHLYVHIDPIQLNVQVDETSGDYRIAEIYSMVSTLIKGATAVATDLSELTTAVENNTSVSQSAIALVDGLKAQLDAAGTDPVALRELSQALSNNSDKLSQALTRNTPAA